MPLRSRYERFFEDRGYPLSNVEHGDWIPASDISETEKKIIFTVELPGIDMKGIDVSYVDGLLTIKGEKKKEFDESESCFCTERYTGTFERSFRIHRDVDRDKIDATYKAGILKLVLPKSEESVPKKIEVH